MSTLRLRSVRLSFWQAHPQFTRHPGWKQDQYPTDVRVAFVDWVDYLHRDGQISDTIAQKVTL